MKSFAFAVLLNILVSSAEDCTLDHDDTLLLQTRAVTKEARRKKVPSIHRYHINVKNDSVSLLQGSASELPEDVTVYQVCAVDDTGNGEEAEDAYGAHIDTGGMMEVFNEAGESQGMIVGISAASVSDGTCVCLQEGPDWVSSATENSLFNVQAVDCSDTSDVVLFEIPDMDSKHFSKVKDEIKKAMRDFPDPRVLFHGSGAKQLPNIWERSFDFMNGEHWSMWITPDGLWLK